MRFNDDGDEALGWREQTASRWHRTGQGERRGGCRRQQQAEPGRASKLK